MIRSAFHSPEDEASGAGKRPVVFDILGPDWETSLLPEGSKLVLHVNPSSMKIQHQKRIERIQTRGGFVEQHWGDGVESINFDMATGGFMRLYAGLSNITGTGQGGGRRETIAYDKYLDMLALFQNNGSIYDSRGNIVLQGQIKVTFDGGVFHGWFDTFSVAETADGPYQFKLSAAMTIQREIMVFRSTLTAATGGDYNSEQEVFNATIEQADAGVDLGIVTASDITEL